MMALTREIYWSPTGLSTHFYIKQSIYGLLLPCFMGYGIWRHVVLWRKGKKEIVFDEPLRRIGFFFKKCPSTSKGVTCTP